MPKSPKRKSLWELRPGDLPGEELTRGYPVLYNLGENAAYRLLICDRRNRGPLHPVMPLAISAALIGVFGAILQSFLPVWGWALLPVYMSYLPDSFIFARRRLTRWGVHAFIPLRLEALAMLAETPCDGRELASALWGSRLTGVARRHWRLIGALAAGAAMLISVYPSTCLIAAKHWIVIPMLLALGAGYWTAHFGSALGGLGPARSDLRFLHEALIGESGANEAWSRIKRERPEAGDGVRALRNHGEELIVWAVCLAFLFGAIGGDRSPSPMAVFFSPMTTAGAMAFGVWIGRRIPEISRRNAVAQSFEELAKHAALILEAAKEIGNPAWHGRPRP